jgi:hypothetical protein
MMVVAEAAEENNAKRESNVAMVTMANDNSNSNRGSRGDDDTGNRGDRDGGKKITNH